MTHLVLLVFTVGKPTSYLSGSWARALTSSVQHIYLSQAWLQRMLYVIPMHKYHISSYELTSIGTLQ